MIHNRRRARSDSQALLIGVVLALLLPSLVLTCSPSPATPAPVPTPPSAFPGTVPIAGTNGSNPSCFVLLRDWPTRTCVFHTDNCFNLTIDQADECSLCTRGYGAYPTLQDCLSPGAPPSSISPLPSRSPILSPSPLPSPFLGSSPRPSPSRPPNPSTNLSHSPSHSTSPRTSPSSLSPVINPQPSTLSPHPQMIPLPGPPPSPPQPNTAPVAQSIPGTGINSSTCFVLIRDFPTRQCQLHTDDCRNLSISQTDECSLCTRGYGAYATLEECELPPAQAGPYAGATQANAVDPSTYPSPALPIPSGCNSSIIAWLIGRQGDPSSSCPHLQPGVRRWEDPQTWGSQGVPQQLTDVVLPSNTKVMITQCSFPSGSATFKSITIPLNSQLIFDDASVLLTVGTIWVQGMLSAGSALCRIQSKITITFSSQLMAGLDISNMGIQVLTTGQLDLHGAQFQPTWTRLAATILPGQNSASLLQGVNWQQGQLVAVATSIFRDEYQNQNEVLSVSGVSADGKTVVFAQNLQFPHYSGPEYQTEVALLSRNIVLQSSADAENTWKGGNVKIQGQGRLEGVMAYRLGQYNTLGAYPFHWHLIGQVSNMTSYVNDCSVFRSFYRCYVVHGTSGMPLINNVGFDVKGHCFYLEDGVEEYNWFEHNLAAFVHVIGDPSGGITQTGTNSYQSANLTQPTDSAAAGFYISNANNAFVNNAASGGWTGYSFPRLDTPIGQFAWMTSFAPASRPLYLFTGNTAHSTGYFYIMAGGIYVGGNVWLDSNNKLNYNSGRWARDTRDLQGNPATQVFKNNKVWLAQWGISHWGGRVIVDQWENHDCTRGANIFGDAQLSNAIINGRSSNQWAQFPLSIWDLDPISGFRWYDTEVRTILANITFQNFVYQPDLPAPLRQAVWSSMVQSDEYKPGYISASINITYQNVDFRAFLRHVPVSTGSSRFFNWIDWDGSASLRGKPTVMGSYPSWWQLDSSCSVEPSSGIWMCDWLPWRTVARLDVHISGYTAPVGTSYSLPPTTDNFAGYVAQFGYRGTSNRSMIITRNEGFAGVTGTGGWYMHLSQGATPFMNVWVTNVPPGTSIIFATRYPPGTTFNIQRRFAYYPSYSAWLTQASSLSDVLNGVGESYYFDGKHLFIKIVDPGDDTIPKALKIGNVTVWGDRYLTLSYDISANNLNCPAAPAGGNFCYMQDAYDDIPDFLPAYNPWMQPYCWDISNDPQYTCTQQAGWGKCNASFMFSSLDPITQTIGSFCAKTCGRCQGSQPVCIDAIPPGSAGRTCAMRRDAGECFTTPYNNLTINGFCGYTCGYCRGNGQPPCIEKLVGDGYTCPQRLSWGNCNQAWMVSQHFCDITCGRCYPGCQDTVPSDGVSCGQRKVWGNCNDPWMVTGGYCAATCGRCPSSG